MFVLQITFLLHFCFPSTLGREEVFKYLLNEIITVLNKVNSWLMADAGTEPNVRTTDNISSSFLYFIYPGRVEVFKYLLNEVVIVLKFLFKP